MSARILLLIITILTGCGSQEDPSSPNFLHKKVNLPKLYRNPDLQDILNQFITDAESRGLNTSQESKLDVVDYFAGLSENEQLPIAGAQSDSNRIGVCIQGIEKNSVNKLTVGYHNYVYLDDSVKDFNSIFIKMVAYHEFYHCIFNGKHQDNELGIMNSHLWVDNAKFWESHWDEMVDNLFEGK